ncbi:MAG: hypothetical protein J7599_02620 [Niabella sp.]|nr:hypothetical protein [Niabella sp.]
MAQFYRKVLYFFYTALTGTDLKQPRIAFKPLPQSAFKNDAKGIDIRFNDHVSCRYQFQSSN